MDDVILNCILEVCCEAGRAEETLAKFIAKQTGLDRDAATKAAACMCAHFDLAEKGTLSAFKASVARLARGPQG